MSRQPTTIYEFGVYRLDVAERLLQRHGEAVLLQPKMFDLLLALVARHGHLLGKDELLKTVWPDAIVEEANLTNNISILRKTLGENGQPLIETVPKRGYRFVAEVREIQAERNSPEAAVKTVAARPIHWRWLALVGGALLVAVAGFAFWRGGERAAPIHSLAVLPFKPLVAESHDEAMELGLADTLITRLSGLRGLNVRPVEAVRKYAQAQTDALVAGQEQQADAVLEGHFQRINDRFRVTALLVRVSDGTIIWAGKFDEQFTHLFAVQDGIAERVAEVLAPRLTGAEQQQLTKRPTENIAAYQLFQKGRHFWNKRGEENLKKAIAYFQQAIAADPNYAQAYAGMADCYHVLAQQLSGNDVLPQAREYATKALALDDSLAEAHTSLAMVKMNYDRDWPGAEREHQRALQLNPGSASGHQRYAYYLMCVGRTEESLAEIKRALELDPVSLSINVSMGFRLHFARRYEQAIEQLRKTLELEPHRAQTRSRLGRVYESAGRYEETIAEFQKARQLEDSAEILAALGCTLGFAGALLHKSEEKHTFP